MLKSMTAYGRAVKRVAIGTITIEIQSLNRKYLDVKVHCSSELRRFEKPVQNWISEVVLRGQVTVKVDIAYEKAAPVSVYPNIELARQIKRAADQIASDLKVQDPLFATQIVGSHRDILGYSEEIKDEELWKEEIKKTFSEALNPFLEMKNFEGKKLYDEFEVCLCKLSEAIEAIEGLSGRSSEIMREKLKQTLEAAFPGKIENEEALLREVCLFAEKVDINEETTRFKAHIEHFRKTMNENRAVGKTLDFICQELFREINTVASKASDIQISHKTIEVKTLLERMREQLQNVE